MTKKRKATTKKTATAEQVNTDELESAKKKYEEELNKAREENENLKRKMQKLQHDNNKVVDLAKQGKLSNIDVTLQANVISTARKVIYPKCPYISTHEHLVKCTKIVGKRMNIASDKMDAFVALYRTTVNNAITTKRNANIQQCRRKIKGKYKLFYARLQINLLTKIFAKISCVYVRA